MSTNRVAVIQAGAIPFQSAATAAKGAKLIASVAENGAHIAVFPEAFLGGYPKGAHFGSPVGKRTVEGREAFLRYYNGAVDLDGPELGVIIEAAQAHGVFVVMGIIERTPYTLYCTVVYIDPDNGLVGKHRKLMPTGGERVMWGFGDGSTLPVFDTVAGRIGAVICWENYMPMLRSAMYAKKIELYCAPTADDRETWLATMRHIALEGRCYVLSACQYLTRGDFPDDYDCTLASADEPDTVLMRGASVIISPMGEVLAGPVHNREDILYAEISTDDIIRSKLDFDPVGHYSRPDVFQLYVDTEARSPVSQRPAAEPMSGHSPDQ